MNLRYPGQYYDTETGLFYYWNRYYDPSTGRYGRSDPIGMHGGMNTYVYSKQNPMIYLGPNGLIWVTIGYDYYGINNTGRWIFNRINRRISDGMNPSMPFSDPKELEGTKRDVIQEWQPDLNDPSPSCGPDGNAPQYGDKRRITQTYKERPDSWAIGGTSYHWQPVVANRNYK